MLNMYLSILKIHVCTLLNDSRCSDINIYQGSKAYLRLIFFETKNLAYPVMIW